MGEVVDATPAGSRSPTPIVRLSTRRCLIGTKFRNQLDARFAHLYHELKRGTDPLCYVDPYLPIESFRRRDEARVHLVELVSGPMAGRLADPPASKDDRDMLDGALPQAGKAMS